MCSFGIYITGSTRVAKSLTVFAIDPTTSKDFDTTQIPDMSTDPLEGFMPYSADLEAGVTVEPSISVPREIGLYPTATLTPDPEEDPPGA